MLPLSWCKFHGKLKVQADKKIAQIDPEKGDVADWQRLAAKRKKLQLTGNALIW
jgi:hypothetical protein